VLSWDTPELRDLLRRVLLTALHVKRKFISWTKPWTWVARESVGILDPLVDAQHLGNPSGGIRD